MEVEQCGIGLLGGLRPRNCCIPFMQAHAAPSGECIIYTAPYSCSLVGCICTHAAWLVASVLMQLGWLHLKTDIFIKQKVNQHFK